ncbi:mitochondrial sulfite oxidase [Naegleria gruberi]|uniref:Mitochondrial sulfite oxidase n=1 Tax=Naegleria gruberi TaxID=5762 RepID=D2V0V9_NAEGR|nr:mitochondrial sulfite oxidase [Naegleria gruberi]EFC49799.1 mitochondrial sulfite oxidase [Naegleria gruberi]|eukprot:XP_002682543.1 mitochondrial sulfite oxidase [Naegleria gruberi strain NEG-M]
MLAAGKSIEPFWEIYRQHHTKEVYEILSQYKIGELHPEDAKKLKEQFEQQKSNSNDIYANDPARNPILVVNMQKPFNAETPPTLLCDKYITPNELFFIRNHLPVPSIDPSTYVLEITGETLKDGPIKLTLDDLKNGEKFKQHTLTVALQCAGNRRTEMSCYKAPRGLGWTNAAVGNAMWTGVKLVDILEAYGITEDKILQDGKVKHVEFVGADTDGISTYATSIPADRALSNKADVLLAFKMNGEDIPIDHGFPIRAIVPGAIGARNVKWLSKIILSEQESQSVWQQKDYKTFSPSTDWDNADFSKSSAVHDAPVQSAICVPSPDSRIASDSETIVVKGYALAGSGNGIERVDITTDNGTTWHTAQLEREPLKYNRNYGWTLWQVEVPLSEKDITEGKLKLCSKAVDTAYNVQPEDVKSIWNIRGILNNTWHCVNVSIENKKE